MEPPCPYCQKLAANSDDHVFPEFLGGKGTVRACDICNSTFGHTFEAAAFEHFRDWMFIFRRSGMKPTKPMTWRNVAFDDTGRRYDVDQDLMAVLSDPVIRRSADGSIVGVEGDPHKVTDIAKSLEAKRGSRFKSERREIKIDLRSLKVTYPIDDDLRRLCMKMSLGCAAKCGVELRVSDESRSYLLTGSYQTETGPPVYIAVDSYDRLDALRPKLAHLIYVRVQAGRTFSALQFFGAIQLYCDFDVADGQSAAVLGVHDSITHEERFSECEPIDVAAPERLMSPDALKAGVTSRFERLRVELVSVFGDQAPLNIHLD